MSEEAIDVNEFLERVQDDKELLLELLDIFVEDYEAKRIQLTSVVANKDYEELSSIAHSLKGATGNISAKPLREIFIKLEELGKESSVEGAEGHLTDLDARYSELSVRIGQLKEEMK